MLKALAAGLLSVLFQVSASSQQAGPLAGSWSAVLHSDGAGLGREATLTIAEGKGTWRQFARGKQGKKDGCIGRDFPVVVDAQSASAATVQVDGSHVMEGCPNTKLSLKQIDANNWEGTVENGDPVKLTRH